MNLVWMRRISVRFSPKSLNLIDVLDYVETALETADLMWPSGSLAVDILISPLLDMKTPFRDEQNQSRKEIPYSAPISTSVKK
jgi:hypothetical protein